MSSAGRAPWAPQQGLPGFGLSPDSVSGTPAEAPCPVLVAAAGRSGCQLPWTLPEPVTAGRPRSSELCRGSASQALFPAPPHGPPRTTDNTCFLYLLVLWCLPPSFAPFGLPYLHGRFPTSNSLCGNDRFLMGASWRLGSCKHRQLTSGLPVWRPGGALRPLEVRDEAPRDMRCPWTHSARCCGFAQRQSSQ